LMYMSHLPPRWDRLVKKNVRDRFVFVEYTVLHYFDLTHHPLI
jgi:hypothetical protein